MTATVLPSRPAFALPTEGVPRALGVLVLAAALLAFLLAPATYAYQARGYFYALFGGGLPVFVLVVTALAMRRRETTPLADMRAISAELAPRFWPIACGYILLMATFTTLKTSIPDFVPFYADPFLAALDRAMHGGDPWVVIHAAAPEWMQRLLSWAYGEPWFLYWIGTVMFVALLPPSERRTHYFWAFALKMLLLGVVVAAASSSVGPIYHDHFFGGDDFAGLRASLEDQAWSVGRLAYVDYLLVSYESGQQGVGTGISAFPSIHCAAVVLNAYFWSQFGRLPALLAWGFAVLILIGSVFTGWHYAVDGYFSFLGVTVIWFASRAILRRAHANR